jgi:hypothetical protein
MRSRWIPAAQGCRRWPGSGQDARSAASVESALPPGGKNPDAVRLFVYTNSLKQFIRGGNDVLDVPDDCILTFDKWCSDTYRAHVDRGLPRKRGRAAGL